MDIGTYVAYLMSSPSGSSCVKASNVLTMSHDAVNRFLLSGNFTGKDLFKSVYTSIDLYGGTLSADDSVLDKPYTKQGTTDLVSRFYSGKHHRVVQGINLIVLVYTSKSGYSVPVNFRVYDKTDQQTKNDYFRQMIKEVWNWGLRPKWVTADSWYSGLDNLKFLRNLEINFLLGIESNRIISGNPLIINRLKMFASKKMAYILIYKAMVLCRCFGQFPQTETRDTMHCINHKKIYLSLYFLVGKNLKTFT